MFDFCFHHSFRTQSLINSISIFRFIFFFFKQLNFDPFKREEFKQISSLWLIEHWPKSYIGYLGKWFASTNNKQDLKFLCLYLFIYHFDREYDFAHLDSSHHLCLTLYRFCRLQEIHSLNFSVLMLENRHNFISINVTLLGVLCKSTFKIGIKSKIIINYSFSV